MKLQTYAKPKNSNDNNNDNSEVQSSIKLFKVHGKDKAQSLKGEIQRILHVNKVS